MINLQLRDLQTPALVDLESSSWPVHPRNLLLSISFHATIILVLLYVPSLRHSAVPQPERRVLTVVDLRKEPLVYRVRAPEELPAISPSSQTNNKRKFRGVTRRPDVELVVERPSVESAKQLVWQPDKPTPLEIETPTQNMVAVREKVQPKTFRLPDRTPGRQVPQELAEPETIPVRPAAPVKVSAVPQFQAPKFKPKDFIPPKQNPALPLSAPVVLQAAPEVALGPERKLPEIGGITGDLTLPRIPPGATAPDAGGPPGEATAAVISVRPSTRQAAVPEGSREASLSAAPRAGKPVSGATSGKMVIPGVAATGNENPLSAAAPMPSSKDTVVRFFEARTAATTLSAPLRPSSRTLPPMIEARFSGRIVYVSIIARPNLPEYSGDWTIWFAERSPRGTSAIAVRAPSPLRKALRPTASRAGGSSTEKSVQMAGVIGKDGKIGSLVALPGRNAASGPELAADLFNWEFRPALKGIEPIEVDVIIEIAFRSH